MAGGFFDTSGLDAQNPSGGSSNNAAQDFGRLNADNPSQFSGGIFDRLFGGRNKKEVQQEALATSANQPPTPLASPSNPAGGSAGKPAISSGAGLVKSILGEIANPPTYNAQGQPLVPGTPFTREEFTKHLTQEITSKLPAFEGIPGVGMGEPPQRELPPFQGIPQFNGPPPPERTPPNAFDALRAAGGNRFGGNTFGGQTFGGQRFGASAPQPNIGPSTMQPGGEAPPPQAMTPTQALMALSRSRGNPNVPQGVGYFRGGSLQMMRGGYPENLMQGLPTRAHGGSSPEQYVPMDGEGDGRSDHVDAKLSPGEFVMDAETVALAGNGNSDAGAKGMEAIRQTIRKEKGKALAQGKFSPNAKKPGFYAQVAMKGVK